MAAKLQAVISFSELKEASTFIEYVFLGTKVSYLLNKFKCRRYRGSNCPPGSSVPIYASSHRQVKFVVCAYQIRIDLSWRPFDYLHSSIEFWNIVLGYLFLQ